MLVIYLLFCHKFNKRFINNQFNHCYCACPWAYVQIQEPVVLKTIFSDWFKQMTITAYY